MYFKPIPNKARLAESFMDTVHQDQTVQCDHVWSTVYDKAQVVSFRWNQFWNPNTWVFFHNSEDFFISSIQPIPKRQILESSKTERVCSCEFQVWWKWQKVIQMRRKHCGKRRNWSLRAISSFPTVFSKKKKKNVLQTCENKGLFGKGLTVKGFKF